MTHDEKYQRAINSDTDAPDAATTIAYINSFCRPVRLPYVARVSWNNIIIDDDGEPRLANAPAFEGEYEINQSMIPTGDPTGRCKPHQISFENSDDVILYRLTFGEKL